MAAIDSKRYDLSNVASKNRVVGFWRLMKGFRGLYLAAIFTLGVSALAKTGTFLLLRQLVDDVLLQDHDTDVLISIALGFIGLALIEGSFTFFSGALASRTAEGVTRRLRNYLFDHLQRLYFKYHDDAKTGDLVQRVSSDVSTINRFFADQAIGIGRIAILFTVNFGALLLLNAQLALFAVIVVPILFVISIFFFSRVGKAYNHYQEQDGRVSTALQENLSGVRVVKAFARQDYEREKFQKENYGRFLLGRKLTMMHAYYWPLTDLLTGVQMLAGYIAGALMVLDGGISVGTYIAYAGLIVQVIQPMRNMGRLIVNASQGLVSYERVAELMREEREPLDTGATPTTPMKGDVTFENVSFNYEDGAEVLNNISFSVKAGASIALLGSTGSGKSSLVGLLPRFYEYTSGKITIDGQDIKGLSREYLRRNIGMVQQEPFLFSRTIRENIMYGLTRDVSEAEMIQAAQAAAVHDVIMTFPENYNTVVGERGVTLSGGQKQRIALARTLLKNPRILLLDDATSSVDTETEAEIREALDRLMANRTTFIIAHRIQSVMDADQIIVLDQGRIVQRGTHETLLEEDGIYRQIYDLQARIESELEADLSLI